MNRLRIKYRIGSFGEYGEIERKIICLECSFKYKFLWMKKTNWVVIFEIQERNLPQLSLIKNYDNLLKIMTDLWLNERERTLNDRVKKKLINNLQHV